MNIIGSASARVLRNKGVGDSLHRLELDPTTASEEVGTPQLVTVKDSVHLHSTVTALYTTGQVVVRDQVSQRPFISLTPEVATINDNGQLTRVSSGVARISREDDGINKFIDINMGNRNATAPVVTFDSFVAGSFGEHATSAIDSLIDNTMSIDVEGEVFTTQDHDTSTYVRNPNLWCAGYDITAVSPWNSDLGQKKAGTLITPRHVLFTAHYPVAVGTTVRFVEADGTVHDRTVEARAFHPSYSPPPYTNDYCVAVLDSDLPATITPMKILPSDFTNYLPPENVRLSEVPAIAINQHEQASIQNLYQNHTDYITFNFPDAAVDRPDIQDRAALYYGYTDGDSGSPMFFIVNGEPVLATVMTYGFGGGGTPTYEQQSALDALIVSCDTQAGDMTGYTVTEADLSEFNFYA